MNYMERLTKTSKKIGMYYEKVAADYLKMQGYDLLEKNYSCKLGEIDLIVTKERYIIFVEVKYRKNVKYGYPREYVNHTKQQRILRIAKYYLMTHKAYELGVRFDVIEILDDKITHLINAFN